MSIFHNPSGTIQITGGQFTVHGTPTPRPQDENSDPKDNQPATEITHHFKRTHVLSADGFSAVQAAFSRNGTRIVAVSNRPSVITWDLDEDGKWRQATRHDIVEGGVVAYLVRIAADGSRVAVGSRTADYSALPSNVAHDDINNDPSNKSILVWDTKSCKISHAFETQTREPVDMTLSKDGSKLAVGFFNDILMWELQNEGYSGGKLNDNVQAGAISLLRFSPDKKKVASLGGYGDSVNVWEYFDGGNLEWELTLRPEEYRLQGSTVSAMALSNNAMLAIGFQDGRVVITSTDRDGWSSEKDRTVSHDGCIVTNLAFSADGKILASSSVNGVVQLWNVATGQPISKQLRAQYSVDMITFSADERKLLAVGREGKLAVWELIQ